MRIVISLFFALLATSTSAQQLLHYDNESDLRDRANVFCDADKRIASGTIPLSAAGTLWARGKSYQSRVNVPPGDPDYAAIQAGNRTENQSYIDAMNGRLALLGKPPVACQ